MLPSQNQARQHCVIHTRHDSMRTTSANSLRHGVRLVVPVLLAACTAVDADRDARATTSAGGAGITPAEIDGHLRFLSSDALEGRAPATRGGELAAEYIAAQLRIAGVEPAVNG